MRHAVERAASRTVDRLVAAVERRRTIARRTAPSVKIAQRQLLVTYRSLVAQGVALPPVWDTGFRVFSQVDEDGVILFLLGAVGIGTARFVDIGGGDGVWASNSANLAFNLGFHGLIVDADADGADRARPTRDSSAIPTPGSFRQRFSTRRSRGRMSTSSCARTASRATSICFRSTLMAMITGSGGD